MEAKLRITGTVFEALLHHHLDPAVCRERISYAFGTLTAGSGGVRTILISDPPILPADDCFLSQSAGHVGLDPQILNAILAAFAASDRDCLINIHDHWFAHRATTFSAIDTEDERRLGAYLYRKFEPMLQRRSDIGTPREVLSVAVVLDRSGLDARYLDRRGRFRQIDCVDVVGPSPRRIRANAARLPQFCGAAVGGVHARHRDFISAAQQDFIAATAFAIIGCGGLGSIAAEALMRLGARRFILVDDDVLDESNLNRWQGGARRDVGRSKAEVLAKRLRKLCGDAAVTPVCYSLFAHEAVFALKRADVLIGCLDNHAARYFLNRFAVQYLLPYFDAGVNIAAGDAVDFESRYFCVIPGYTACMECTAYTLFDRDEVAYSLMDEVTATARRAAGYVGDRPEISTASAYPLNLRAVSTLTIELLNWICGFRPTSTCASESWRSARWQRSDRANHPEGPDPECPCCGLLLGVGDRAELPRPPRHGHVARLMAETREQFLALNKVPAH